MSAPTSPAGKYLLDTSVVVALQRGDPDVAAAIRKADRVHVSATVLGELYHGALHSANPARNVARVAELAAAALVLACDGETALVYGGLKADLRRRGRPIPENDIWIAASAVQHGITLVTRDAHFDALPQLTRERW